MKYLAILSVILLASSGFAKDETTDVSSTTDDSTTQSTTSELTTLSTTTQSSSVPTTASSTTISTTTTSESTTSTEASSTQSVAPTSTVAPSTSSVPTSPQPTTVPTTTGAPITTTKTPIPVPTQGSWTVTSGNTTCIRADLKILFKISLPTHDDYIALSPNASSEDSNCNLSNTTQELVLTDANYKLTFIFEKNGDSAYVRNISFNYDLPDSKETVENDTQLFNVRTGNCYLCSASDVVLGNVTMQISYIKLQAFGAAGNKDFGTVEECEADNQVNDIVPIAVGIALLALVVVVLIAYLVGRRRSRQKGYQSV